MLQNEHVSNQLLPGLPVYLDRIAIGEGKHKNPSVAYGNFLQRMTNVDW